MTVTINHVDLSVQQVRALHDLLPIRGRLIEQVKIYGGSRVTVKTFVRVGAGANKREWLLLRNGRAIENPTPGKGTPRG